MPSLVGRFVRVPYQRSTPESFSLLAAFKIFCLAVQPRVRCCNSYSLSNVSFPALCIMSTGSTDVSLHNTAGSIPSLVLIFFTSKATTLLRFYDCCSPNASIMQYCCRHGNLPLKKSNHYLPALFTSSPQHYRQSVLLASITDQYPPLMNRQKKCSRSQGRYLLENSERKRLSYPNYCTREPEKSRSIFRTKRKNLLGVLSNKTI